MALKKDLHSELFGSRSSFRHRVVCRIILWCDALPWHGVKEGESRGMGEAGGGADQASFIMHIYVKWIAVG